MIRSLHRWPGLVAALFLIAVSLSGTILSVFPALESVSTPSVSSMTAAQMVEAVQTAHPGLEELSQSASGRIVAWFPRDGEIISAVVDPVTGGVIGTTEQSAFHQWMVDFHRSLFLDDAGRIGVATISGIMVILALSGLHLIARRNGGWTRILSPMRGADSGRWHAEIARLAVAGLILSSVTGLWMSASIFNLLPESAGAEFPSQISEQTGFDIAKSPFLLSLPADELRNLKFPVAGDSADAYTVMTTSGEGFIDQGTGETLNWTDASLVDRISSTFQMLHTGEGASVLGLVLGLSAFGVPAMAWTGTRKWAAGRSNRKSRVTRIEDADAVVMVASEGGTTWGFAETLARELEAKGARVHVQALSEFDPAQWKSAKLAFILAATYGEGEAPSSAGSFVDRLTALPNAPSIPVAVLGFGDRTYPDFCGYARTIAGAADKKGWKLAMPLDTIDRQSPQDFARWGQSLSALLKRPLTLEHQAAAPVTCQLTLISRRDYGESVQNPGAILRFALPTETLAERVLGTGFGSFVAGDLLSIVPEGSTLPRLYSLASARKDGFVEICVRKHVGGLCSGQLMALRPGDTIEAALRENPAFRVNNSTAPLILIGAGTGIGPLAGFIRANRKNRPLHLFFGTRHVDSDFYYAEELTAWQLDGRITKLSTAFSRGSRPHYVQDALQLEADHVASLVRDGASIMVCGGREMAQGVRNVLTDILEPHGISPAALKIEGRYAEDIY